MENDPVNISSYIRYIFRRWYDVLVNFDQLVRNTNNNNNNNNDNNSNNIVR